MASPQKENGFSGIANELLEKIYAFRFPSASPLQIWLFVLRKTYGFHKKTDIISLSQIVRGTKLTRQTVNVGLQWLVNACLLVKGGNNIKGTVYGVNKDYEQWVVNAPRLVKRNTFQLVNAPRHTKETITKENIYSKSKDLHKNMNLEELNDGEVRYTVLDDKTPKRYQSRKKPYARIAVYYMQATGKEGNALRYFKDIKELWEVAGKTLKEDEIEQEIKDRIDLAVWYYQHKGWTYPALGKIIENWDIILNDWALERKKHR